MQKIWLGMVFLCLLVPACVPTQETILESRTLRVTTTPKTIATLTNTPLSPSEAATYTASPPINTPTQTTKPPSPTIIAPAATRANVELSHPLLSAEILDPGSHAPYSYLLNSGEEVRYLLFLPESFDPQLQWPVIVVFHGHGGKGRNINRIIEDSLPEILDAKEGFPFIVISPQLPSGFWTSYIDPVDELIDSLVEILSIDPNRLYLTGYSVGGYGAWKYALRYPGRFAAVAPIAGIASLTSGDPVPEDICNLKELPIWVFHGEADTVILPEHSIAAVEALKSCGGNVKLTLYPNAGHPQAWLNAYTDADFYEWLLENKRSANP